jgi:hypothetical protein
MELFSGCCLSVFVRPQTGTAKIQTAYLTGASRVEPFFPSPPRVCGAQTDTHSAETDRADSNQAKKNLSSISPSFRN